MNLVYELGIFYVFFEMINNVLVVLLIGFEREIIRM